MASKSIIPENNLGAKSPFNKKLILVLLIIIAVSIGAAAILGKSTKSAPEPEKKDEEVPFTEGTSRNVKLEFDSFKPEDKPTVPQKVDTAPVIQPLPRSEPMPGGALNTKGDINHPKEDLVAQAAISAISVTYQDEGQGSQFKAAPVEKTAEQKIAELLPGLPERVSEQEALSRSIAMSAAAAAQAGGFPNGVGVLDQSGATALATKTKRFMNETEQQHQKYRVSRKNAAPGTWVVTAGKTIPAITKRAQSSDLPCAVEAITSVDVYDSYTSTKLLIPKGSELVGVCSNDVAIGQNRILSAFNRLILPNGDWFDLNNGVGMDRSGATGLKGDVNNHFFQMFSSAFLIAFIADRVERNKSNQSTNLYMGSQQGAKTAAGQVLVDTSQFVLGRNKTIQPTIDVEAGTRIYVQVKHDMVFD